MNLDEVLAALAREPALDIDLAEVVLHLARDEYPELDVEAELTELAAMAHEARRYMRGDQRAQVDGLCRYLFHDMGFHGNLDEYYDPRNSYLNLVLERRTGIPITLSIVTIAVGTRAGLSVSGVGVPGHFIAKVSGGPEEILVDSFHGGRILTHGDCENLVRQVTGMEFEASPLTLATTPPGLTVQRLLTNLRGIYLQQEDWLRAARVLARLRQLKPQDVVLRRDLGICLLRQGRPGAAVDHLEAYLGGAGEASDANAVRTLLKTAWRGLGDLN
jgi:regulator of sirC expression with transglutaminase-like and TPR domain